MVNLPDLPAEIILQILSHFGPSTIDLFWHRGITHQTLIPFSFSLDNKSRAEQIENAKRLALVCKQLRPVCASIVWMRLECNPIMGLKNLFNICKSKHRLAGYVQELVLQLPYLPLDELEAQLKDIWPHLTTLHTLTLTLTSAHGCPSWLVAHLKSIPNLHTLRLRVMGDSIGPHLRQLSNIRNLYIEIYPPDIEDRDADPLGPGPPLEPAAREGVSRDIYHSWFTLFNDLMDLIDSCKDIVRMGWHVHWTMAHAFYRHVSSKSEIPNNPSLSIRRISVLPPFLTSLSVSLESQLGTESFVRALSGLPITDLALVSYDHMLLLGAEFEKFCKAFGHLRRLRLKLRAPSITVGGGSPKQFPIDMEYIARGLSSLSHLRSYRGPIVIKRPEPMSPPVASSILIRKEAKSTLIDLANRLEVKGVSSDTLFQWSVWVDGKYGPKEFEMVPNDGPRRLDQMSEDDLNRLQPYSHEVHLQV
ncbi:F-box-like domain protein [Rhizoctonia solani 123E]|uniref:F-box-like domain protein n=1 Tax=Rhizoctonia solani 123E TaxID=1423351 RepID=A0A074RZU6_9AGAM|nr:F-box-like domain protein [Rhizoctonia solani 123E]